MHRLSDFVTIHLIRRICTPPARPKVVDDPFSFAVLHNLILGLAFTSGIGSPPRYLPASVARLAECALHLLPWPRRRNCDVDDSVVVASRLRPGEVVIGLPRDSSRMLLQSIDPAQSRSDVVFERS